MIVTLQQQFVEAVPNNRGNSQAARACHRRGDSLLFTAGSRALEKTCISVLSNLCVSMLFGYRRLLQIIV
jgi:hypothetical protein